MAEHTPTPWETQEMPSASECRERGDWLMLKGPDWFHARAAVNAFYDPKRTIATEQISEGLFWRMYDAIKWGQSDLQRKTMLASLQIEEKADG